MSIFLGPMEKIMINDLWVFWVFWVCWIILGHYRSLRGQIRQFQASFDNFPANFAEPPHNWATFYPTKNS